MGLFDVFLGKRRARQSEPEMAVVTAEPERSDAHDLITFFDVETPNRKNDRM